MAAWREIGHVFAWHGSETGEGRPRQGGDVAQLAVAPRWLTALILVAGADGIAPCPRRLAERHAERLGLQVVDPPFEPDRIKVSWCGARRRGTRESTGSSTS